MARASGGGIGPVGARGQRKPAPKLTFGSGASSPLLYTRVTRKGVDSNSVWKPKTPGPWRSGYVYPAKPKINWPGPQANGRRLYTTSGDAQVRARENKVFSDPAVKRQVLGMFDKSTFPQRKAMVKFALDQGGDSRLRDLLLGHVGGEKRARDFVRNQDLGSGGLPGLRDLDYTGDPLGNIGVFLHGVSDTMGRGVKRVVDSSVDSQLKRGGLSPDDPGVAGVKKFLGNAGRDLGSLVPNMGVGLYQLSRDVGEGVRTGGFGGVRKAVEKDVVQPTVETLKHPVRSFEEAPFTTGLIVGGAAAVPGRLGGAVGRSGLLGQRVARAADTGRGFVQVDPTLGTLQARHYSKNVMTKQLQRAKDALLTEEVPQANVRRDPKTGRVVERDRVFRVRDLDQNAFALGPRGLRNKAIRMENTRLQNSRTGAQVRRADQRANANDAMKREERALAQVALRQVFGRPLTEGVRVTLGPEARITMRDGYSGRVAAGKETLPPNSQLAGGKAYLPDGSVLEGIVDFKAPRPVKSRVERVANYATRAASHVTKREERALAGHVADRAVITPEGNVVEQLSSELRRLQNARVDRQLQGSELDSNLRASRVIEDALQKARPADVVKPLSPDDIPGSLAEMRQARAAHMERLSNLEFRGKPLSELLSHHDFALAQSNIVKGGVAFVHSAMKAAERLTRDPRIPARLKQGLILSLFPWVGPIDNIATVALLTWIVLRYRHVLVDAVKHAGSELRPFYSQVAKIKDIREAVDGGLDTDYVFRSARKYAELRNVEEARAIDAGILTPEAARLRRLVPAAQQHGLVDFDGGGVLTDRAVEARRLQAEAKARKKDVKVARRELDREVRRAKGKAKTRIGEIRVASVRSRTFAGAEARRILGRARNRDYVDTSRISELETRLRNAREEYQYALGKTIHVEGPRGRRLVKQIKLQAQKMVKSDNRLEREYANEVLWALRQEGIIKGELPSVELPSITERNRAVKEWEAKYGMSWDDVLTGKPIDISPEALRRAQRLAKEDMDREQATPARDASDPRATSSTEPSGWTRISRRSLTELVNEAAGRRAAGELRGNREVLPSGRTVQVNPRVGYLRDKLADLQGTAVTQDLLDKQARVMRLTAELKKAKKDARADARVARAEAIGEARLAGEDRVREVEQKAGVDLTRARIERNSALATAENIQGRIVRDAENALADVQARSSELAKYRKEKTKERWVPAGSAGGSAEAVTVEALTDLLRRNGVDVDALGYVPHRPGDVRKGDFYKRDTTNRTETLMGDRYTGSSWRRANYDASIASIEARMVNQALVRAVMNSMADMIREIGVPARNNQGELRLFTADAALRMIDKIDNEGGPHLIAVRAFRASDKRMSKKLSESLETPKEGISLGDVYAQVLKVKFDRKGERVPAGIDLNEWSRKHGQTANIMLVDGAAMGRILKHADLQILIPGIGAAFRRTVLPFSPRWLGGNIAEAVLRSTIAGVTPLHARVYADMLTQLMLRDEQWANQLRLNTEGGMMSGSQLDMTVKTDRSLKRESGMMFGDSSAARRTASQVARVLNAGVVKTTDAVFKFNKVFEDFAQRAAAGKHARQQVQEFTGSWLKAVRKQSDGMKELLDSWEENPAKAYAYFDDAARYTNETLGKYTQFSPVMRQLIQGYTPFIAWYLNSVRFFAYTLPIKHPLFTGVVAASVKAIDQDLKDTLNQAPKGRLRHGIPVGDKEIFDIARITPLGVATEPLETLAKEPVPMVTGPLFIAFGLNPIKPTEALMDENAKAIDSGWLRFGLALQAFAEGTVPGLGLARRLRTPGLTQADNSTLLSPKVRKNAQQRDPYAQFVYPWSVVKYGGQASNKSPYSNWLSSATKGTAGDKYSKWLRDAESKKNNAYSDWIKSAGGR